MNTFTLFKQSLFHFSELHNAKKMPFWKVIFYIIFLSVILALPITTQVFSMMHDIRHDGQTIAEKLPDFKIMDGQLQTAANTEGFIYQTNSIIFTFDPDGKRSVNDIVADSVGNAIGIGFLKNEFVVALPNSGAATSLFGTSEFEFPYSKGTLDGVNSDDLKTGLNETNIPFWLKLIVFIVTLYPTFLNLIINILLVTIGANLYSKIRLYKLRFFDCLKISAYCATLPVILSSFIYAVHQSFDDSFLIIFMTLLIFFFAIRKEEQRKLPLE